MFGVASKLSPVKRYQKLTLFQYSSSNDSHSRSLVMPTFSFVGRDTTLSSRHIPS